MHNLIEKYVALPSSNSIGWHNVVCPVCNDYKVRGGFNITEDRITYHCFNCGLKASYFKDSGITDTMKQVLISFHVPLTEIQKLKLKSFGKTPQPHKKEVIIEDNPICELELPKSFYHIKQNSDPWSEVAFDYLEHDRGITDDTNFFLSKGNTTPFEKLWYGRLIIPYYREGKLVYYQGRSLTDNNRRYINSTTNANTTILYNYDELYKNNEDPLFIVEGFFDAYHIKGIAINGNELTEKKINIINKSKRQKIYVPDRYGNGKKAALNALDAGWDISLPDIGECKDINEAIMRFGYMYVYRSLLSNITSGNSAKIKLNACCK